MIKYKKMAADRYKECGLLLARAFADYDYFKIYFPDDKKRALYLQCAMTLTLKLHRDNAVILTAEDDNNLCAVCILFPPNVHRKPALDYLLNGFLKMYFYAGFKSVSSWLSMDSSASKPCHSLSRTSWYVNTLGVAPEKQGCGIGSRFINDCIIPFIKENGGNKLCLFTNSEENRLFYQQNGFSQFKEEEYHYKGKSLGSWSYIKEI